MFIDLHDGPFLFALTGTVFYAMNPSQAMGCLGREARQHGEKGCDTMILQRKT